MTDYVRSKKRTELGRRARSRRVSATALRLLNLLTVGLLVGCAGLAVDTSVYPTVSLQAVDLDRQATTLTRVERGKYPGAHFAFRWNDDDNKTRKWRPQGISGIVADEHQFIAVTWYARPGYKKRGARISLVDVSDPNSVRYRNILLVDEEGNTFKGMHAGGLVYRHGDFHVPDSRDKRGRIHVFPASGIKVVPVADRDKFFGYAYILESASSYEVPIKPSFLSFDWEQDKFLVGSFEKCSKKHRDTADCLMRSDNRLAWYTLGDVDENSPSCAPFFGEMQGAASGLTSRGHTLWVASSYGRCNDSHLHIANFSPGHCNSPDREISNLRVLTYPPGLEDLHLSQTSEDLWMLTEFGPHEGQKNNRVVFAVQRRELLP